MSDPARHVAAMSLSAHRSRRDSSHNPEAGARVGAAPVWACTVAWGQGVCTMAEVSRSETIRMLDGVPLFSGLTKRQLAAVAKLVDHMSFGPGAVLVEEMDVGRRLIIIREGTAEVRRRGLVGREGTEQETSRRVATVGPGDVVGELSLIDGKPTSASVVADTQLEALVLFRTRFNKLLGSMPELYPRLLVGMAARVRAIDHRGDIIG
ncbi:MAG: cyclic nucleotide-binding domain-containing protein [Acidimicrobiales bacterium]|nr:MAG: cyclic nucleotide-binding domain-containing protein [Acidimicrobiales bacterium]